MVTSEYLDPTPVAGLASLFDDGLGAPWPGDPLPPLWHWVALPRWAASGALSGDGHPRRGENSFLPPVNLPRRMFAGGHLRLHRPLIVGTTIRRESEVTSVTEKRGRSGRLVIVDVAIRLFDESGELAVEETQNLIYREASATIGRVQPPPDQPPGHPLQKLADLAWELRTDPSLLVRFSAVTANAHRIHYDWPYATQVEGYPGLLVHGPLLALAQVQTHRLSSGAPITSLRHRGVAPLFCGQPAVIRSADTESGVALTVAGPNGICASVELTTQESGT